jgi:secondary thiamine-phosphate synthase enzyme
VLPRSDISKSSIVTIRETPVLQATSAAGGLMVHAETLTVQTEHRVELVDLTDQVMAFARGTGIREGLANIWSMHTTCGVFINEAQRALHADIKSFLEQMVARDAEWLHNDPDHSDCDRFNADAHLRAMLLGHGLTMQVTGGEIVLGQWQRILLAELDGPRARTVRVQEMGI